MKKKRTYKDLSYSKEIDVSAFGFELVRQVLIPELLGNEQSQILYWAGRRLARDFPLSSIDEVVSFFQQAGWGELRLEQEKKNELTFSLSSELIIRRNREKVPATYQLEAGFLAQQIQEMKNCITESYESEKGFKNNKLQLFVKWDKKDELDSEAAE
ncbi:YslB family protein [Pseudalkalibacillus caeni]|uniref:DUF2507 domain-containing protein n=1 Tax=Exobacillus caeni TaxID=2574798 RepID=A0A5R9F628_9BACL|nr:YslB family protein [Pseudalkalibacillus caeni]TLS39192.1 DUF2507 domain-containing protein [Pseudalkalibacillus caeni]